MSESVKLTTEELQRLEDLRRQSDELVFTAGQLQIQRIDLEKRLRLVMDEIAKLDARYDAILDNETKYNTELFEKYGPVSIDIGSGTVTPTK